MTMTSNLSIALNPQSIAIVGASDNPDKIGGRCLSYVKKFGFRGSIYPINPTRELTQGVKTYPSFEALPGVADLAVICVPGEQAVEAVDSCGKHGTKVAVIVTAGFGESNEAGRELERQMVARARATGLRLIGPNTQGLANFSNGAIANFSTMFIETDPTDGPVAIISQSGGMSAVPFGLLRQRGIGVRHCHSIGNQCDVTVSELAVEVARDPDVQLLLLYLEGIPDPERLAELGAIARERELPVLALKSGRTPAGQAASKSHTGSLATEDRVVDAFLEHHGVMRVEDVGGLVDAAELYLKGWRPKGRRLVVISNSGTACVLSADAATKTGLSVDPLQDATRADLAKVLPSFATTTNPVDITAALLTNSRLFGDILPVIAQDPGADCFLISVPVAGRGYDVEAFATDAAEFAKATGKPVVIAAPQPSVAARFKDRGLPVFVKESAAIAALHQLISHHELMARVRQERGGNTTMPNRRNAEGAGITLNEAESLDLLSAYGVSVVPHVLCHSEDEAVAARARFPGDVVVKGCSRDVTHKSDLGLVFLAVTTDEKVRDAYRRITVQARAHRVRLDGVIVAPMVPGGRRELIVGAHLDPTFGPVIAVGDGGKYVEVLPDMRILMRDASRSDILRALRSLRIGPILDGIRGEKPVDLKALCKLIEGAAECIADPGQRVQSLDINPVIVMDQGQGCVAVDSVVVSAQPERA
jgi:acyl-CoA synthetase (NDP forming)